MNPGHLGSMDEMVSPPVSVDKNQRDFLPDSVCNKDRPVRAAID